MIYDLNYFIAKFEAIPEENIIPKSQTGDIAGVGCVYGQCSSNVGFSCNGHTTREGLALKSLLQTIPNMTGNGEHYSDKERLYANIPARINNGEVNQYPQPTPKQRILAALYDIKANQAVAEAESIINAEPQTQVA